MIIHNHWSALRLQILITFFQKLLGCYDVQAFVVVILQLLIYDPLYFEQLFFVDRCFCVNRRLELRTFWNWLRVCYLIIMILCHIILTPRSQRIFTEFHIGRHQFSFILTLWNWMVDQLHIRQVFILIKIALRSAQ